MDLKNILNFFRINKKLAIDLGTSNVLIYDTQKNKIVLNEPSVIVFDKKTKKVIAVGSDAKEMIGRNPESHVVIRPLKDGVISELDAARQMLTEFIKKIYGLSPFKPDIMICVPIEVTTVEKRALFDSIIGAKKIYLIEEGRAAIIGSGVDISRPVGNMVIDIGGGSTDIAVLSLNEIIVSKSIRIAGNLIDNAIIQYVKRNLNLLIGEKTAESIKKNLANAMIDKSSEDKEMYIKGRHLHLNIPISTKINEKQVHDAIMPVLNQIFDSVKDVLSRCPASIATDILDNGIILTGGGSLIRNYDKYISEKVNIKVIVPDKPLESVVIGASRALKDKKLLRTLLMKEQ